MTKYIECEAAYRFAQDQLKKETGAYSKGWNNAMNVIKGALHNNDALPAANVVARDCYDKILVENDDMRAIIDTYGGLKNIQIAFVKLHEIETADVVPVVRCGDCKWFQINMRQDGYLPKGVPECECRHWCGACDPTDFCSYGALIDKDGDIDGV